MEIDSKTLKMPESLEDQRFMVRRLYQQHLPTKTLLDTLTAFSVQTINDEIHKYEVPETIVKSLTVLALEFWLIGEIFFGVSKDQILWIFNPNDIDIIPIPQKDGKPLIKFLKSGDHPEITQLARRYSVYDLRGNPLISIIDQKVVVNRFEFDEFSSKFIAYLKKV